MIANFLSSMWATIAPALGNHLWQSTLFAVVAGLLTLILRKNQARVRDQLWMAASLKFLIPFSLLIALGSHLAKPRASTPAQVIVYSAVEDFSQPFAGPEMPSISQAPAPVTQMWLSDSSHCRNSVPPFNRANTSRSVNPFTTAATTAR